MFIFGHIGITLGVFSLLNNNRKNCTYRQLLFVSAFALMPDILDKGIHWLVPVYPDHGVFHSVFIYAAVLPVLFFFSRNVFYIVAVMAGNTLLDIVNNDIKALIYPVFGWDTIQGAPPIVSPVTTFMDRWPETIGYRLPTGHYFLFEAIGGLIMCFLIVKNLVKQN